MSDESGRATHRCEDCKTDLTLLWDDRDDTDTSPVCGECGGTNVHRLTTDGGRAIHRTTEAGDSLRRPFCERRSTLTTLEEYTDD